MRELHISPDELVAKLLQLSETFNVSILDSAGAAHSGSSLLIAGIEPVETIEISGRDVPAVIYAIDNTLSRRSAAAIFTISYDFGEALAAGIKRPISNEPDFYAALYEALVVHDYRTGHTFVAGNGTRCDAIYKLLSTTPGLAFLKPAPALSVRSNFDRDGYLYAILAIKENIRAGLTYQVNLTQQLTVQLAESTRASDIFAELRRINPAAYGAFLQRGHSVVISASPEQFFKIDGRSISVAPIKGTRPRGQTPEIDERLKSELVDSRKDRAENFMIVDLMRNDLGKVSEFGTVGVETLCEPETLPTLFHLVSKVKATLCNEVTASEVIAAIFPSGSITGAPKKSTVEIIGQLEPNPRGLSMGSIGINIPKGFGVLQPRLETSVAIRTMVVRGYEAVFSVGGGIVIDSTPAQEYEESMLKARALLAACAADGMTARN